MTTLVPQRFGPAWRTAVGLIQRPTEPTSGQTAFLLARPIGMLADRLVRTGATVMRFDYHGTGDSPGEEADQSVADWARDIEEAQGCLLAGCQPAHADWFGMGLGANLMLQAALRVPRPPRRLVLWEPVTDGVAHLGALIEAHRQEMALQLDQTWSDLIAQGVVKEPSLPGSVLGFHMGPQLTNDIQNLPALTPWLSLAIERGVDITVCVPQASSQSSSDAMQPALKERLHWTPLQSPTNWLSSEAMGAAVVPPELNRILEALTR
jgi:uncharacterized protein